ncbi:hypothetical protein BDQ12DRAFT_721855 [Crucibulum laeve]|uniref:Mediator of RNA polymerase II transcription subunit 19 n=1 Tax=Crucibulum laeve TaxID=68775 RepID=A0A5C3M4T6_9AGAR|nr:hypothetical protein BDQ12DRAFT_721855 [Crucibulum laeve]
MNSEHTNAIAGPSNIHAFSSASSQPAASSSVPHLSPLLPLFLPPSGPPPPKQHLASTQDLLGQFNLHSAYDKYVRPFTTPGNDPALDGLLPTTPGGPGISNTSGGVDKGKGRELLDTSSGAVGQGQTPGAMGGGEGDGDDDDGPGGKGEKKKKNTYKHLIKGVPGKHSLKKDDYLATMMLVPPKQRIPITLFDDRTQKDAFHVNLDGLKGWNVNVLVVESAQAREDRKKRKELKRLAKAQQAQGLSTSALPTAGSTPIAHPQPIQAPIPTAASVQSSRISTPRPATGGPSTPQPPGTGTPRPSSTVPRPGSAVPRPGSTIPRPGSAVARPGSAASTPLSQRPAVPPVQVPTGRVGTPLRTGTPTSATSVDQRGKKRERDDVGTPVQPNGVANGNGYGGPGVGANANGGVNGSMVPKPIVNARAGNAGIRPRPFKKQRMDVQGQARDASAPVQQQPTPTGI